MMKKILIVASSTETLELKDHKKHATGYYLNELAIPAQYFMDAGYAVVIATPDGRKPHMDDRSNNLTMFDNNEAKLKAAVKFVVTHPSMQKPQTLKEAAKHSKDYIALFVPGGHAPMNDLMQDPDLGKLLRDFHKDKKITAFLCHGSVAALAALPKAQEYKRALMEDKRTLARELAKNWQYTGYEMTAFSDDEERIVEKEMKGEMPFYVADALTLAGAFVENAPVFKSFVVQDRELITGQNPASDAEFAKLVIKAIGERKTANFSERPYTRPVQEDHTADM
jgi:putative intracellular protease/amidase